MKGDFVPTGLWDASGVHSSVELNAHLVCDTLASTKFRASVVAAALFDEVFWLVMFAIAFRSFKCADKCFL